MAWLQWASKGYRADMMKTVLSGGRVMTKPMSIVLMMLAGWVNRRQEEAIAYLKEENKILREKLGPNRILLNDSQRRRLAILGKNIGRHMLTEVSANTVSP